MLKIKRDINQQDLKIVDLHFDSPYIYSCGFREGGGGHGGSDSIIETKSLLSWISSCSTTTDSETKDLNAAQTNLHIFTVIDHLGVTFSGFRNKK